MKVNLDKLPIFDPAWISSTEEVTRHSPSPVTTIRNPKSYCATITAVSGQGGHNQTFRVACKLRDAGLSEAEALAAMIEWNASNADPPWQLKELTHKVTEAYKKAPQA